jgi:ABC-type nickel/cobalt efflux system permease component RcnA
MVLLGLLLVVLSGGAAVLLVANNYSSGPEYSVLAFGNEIAVVNGWQIFMAGVVLTLAFFLGLWMIAAAGRRRRRMRSEVMAARHDAEAAAAERDRLAEQLSEQQTATMPAHTDADAHTGGRRRFFGRHHAADQDRDRTPTPTPTDVRR